MKLPSNQETEKAEGKPEVLFPRFQEHTVYNYLIGQAQSHKHSRRAKG